MLPLPASSSRLNDLVQPKSNRVQPSPSTVVDLQQCRSISRGKYYVELRLVLTLTRRTTQAILPTVTIILVRMNRSLEATIMRPDREPLSRSTTTVLSGIRFADALSRRTPSPSIGYTTESQGDENGVAIRVDHPEDHKDGVLIV